MATETQDMTPARVAMAWRDTERTYSIIREVKDDGDGWSIGSADGWWIGAPKRAGVTPEQGQALWTWGRGFGYPVRGIAVGLTVLRYETADEMTAGYKREAEERERKQRAEHEANRAETDARVAALPDAFRRRLARFRQNNPDFAWKYEGYELFTCEQAAAFAAALKTDDALREFYDLPYAKQRKRVPAMSDGHSGNTFGAAVALARLYLRDPELVVQMHGALAPLVGSAEYGCVPRATEEVPA